MPGAIDVRVQVADALNRSSELLVLKYAQFSYGLDAALVTSAGIDRRLLPAPGTHLLLDVDWPGGPRRALFLGVPRLTLLDYQQIREFGRRALAVAREVAPDAREICLTLHGPGYGLDEMEAFESELAGITDAIRSREVGDVVEAVTFVERDGRRAERMTPTVRQFFPGGRIARGPSRHALPARQEARLNSVGYDSRHKEHALVAMPFADEFDDHFHYGIEPSIKKAGFLCERMDMLAFTGDVVDMLKRRIDGAAFVVADVTGANANVYLEIGYAWGGGIPTVLIRAKGAELKFDIRGQRSLAYGSIRDLETKLSAELAAMYPGRAPRL